MNITNTDFWTNRVDVFEVVDKIPNGYFVWNIRPIGEDEDYIPLAQWLKPNDNEDFYVNLNTLKAIKVGKRDAMIISKATSWGMATKAEAEKAVLGKRVNKTKRGRAIMALPIYERIS